MTNKTIKNRALLTFIILLISSFSYAGHPINDYFKKHKNDQGMEAKVVPPKLASLFVDEDYPEAIDVLQSMSSLKYLNFYGDKNRIVDYTLGALKAKGSYHTLLDDVDGSRQVKVYGEKKNGSVRKIMAVVQTKTQFLLIIGKGKLNKRQIENLPALSKEIQ
jgi:hypothetical protein